MTISRILRRIRRLPFSARTFLKRMSPWADAQDVESSAPRYELLALPAVEEQAAPAGGLPRVAVHIHVHYTELLGELLEDVANLPGEIDLFVTTTQPIGPVATQVHGRFPRAKVWRTENRGKDIGPFIDAIARYKLDEYELVLKLHGKKSLNLPGYLEAVQNLFGKEIRNGDDWRRGLITPLAANRCQVAGIYQAFAADAALGMVGAARFICRVPDIDQATYRTLCLRLGVAPHVLFFGGSIFWIRGRHLKRLSEAQIILADFKGEDTKAVEGTLEHACERVFGALVAADGAWVGGLSEIL